MTIVLNGNTGVSDVDGSASTPAFRGTDTNTGIFFPAADTIAFAEGGTEVMRIDSSGNVGIGTTSPVSRLNVVSGTQSRQAQLGNISDFPAFLCRDSNGTSVTSGFWDATQQIFTNAGTERMRIDPSGNLLVGTTSVTPNPGFSIYPSGGFSAGNSAGGSGFEFATFRRSGTQIGSITQSGTTNVAYNTSSDYRLKENITPMTGALSTVQALKPCTYTWKTDGSDGQGFIAHELAEVVPDCVTGEKDAVDADGNPVYQGIDTSFLVATLTAAIQELKAELDTVKAELATLKGAA